MLSLVLALSLAAEPAPDARPEVPRDALPELVPRASPPADAPPEPAERPRAAKPPSLAGRVALTGLASLVGAGAGLGLSFLFCGPTCYSIVGGQPIHVTKGFEYTFSNAVLGALLITGCGYVVHQLFGGKGEGLIALAVSLVVMAGAAIAAPFFEAAPLSMLVTTAIGAGPAALGTVLALELSQPKLRVVPMAVRGGAGLAVVGEF